MTVLRAAAAAGAGCVLLVAATGCGGEQSTLDPQSHAARDIADLWWWMLVVACVVFGGAVVFLFVAFLRRRRSGLPALGDREPVTFTLVIVFGIVIPVLTLAGLFTAANILVMGKTNAPSVSSTSLTVEVVGHQWWWEFRYAGTKAVTANEMHLPTKTRVNVVVHTADVIHSFWVPQLNRKIDTIPGKSNRILLYADKPGAYRGQCAEFCGLQHAHMALYVYAEPRAQFESWLRNEASAARAPSTGEATHGRDVFLSRACASCHAIRGTSAKGRVGPDLTHLGSRRTLAALTLPNTPGELYTWIAGPQSVKPGNKMPGLVMSAGDRKALVAYLEGLK